MFKFLFISQEKNAYSLKSPFYGQENVDTERKFEKLRWFPTLSFNKGSCDYNKIFWFMGYKIKYLK